MAVNLAKRFGTYESTPAVWNDVEAWSLTNGVWRSVEPFVMWHEARVLSESEFTKTYPGVVKTLPKESFVT